MDLEDLLEDLLDDAAAAARRQVRKVSSSTKGVRRRARRTVRAVGGVTAVVLLLLATALVTLGTPGGVQILLAVLLALPGLLAAGVAAAAHVAERRDPDVIRDRARRTGRPEPAADLADDIDLPKAVRRDWSRLLQARGLVQDLARDGWVDGASLLQLDDEVLRLHRLLVADRRTTSLGGRAATALHTRVADLADLLVALADEAVHLQVEAGDARSTAAATVEDAREHLHTLRLARREVAHLDAPPHPAPGTG